MRIKNLATITALCLPAPLLAQSANNALCGVAADTEIFNTLAGNYTLVHGPGSLSVNGIAMPFPQSEPFEAEIFELEGKLHLFADFGVLRLIFSDKMNAAPLAQVAPGPGVQANIDQINAAACPQGNSLPRLFGEGEWDSADGVKMSAGFAMVFSTSQEGTVHGWGFMNSSGGGVVMATQLVLDTAE